MKKAIIDQLFLGFLLLMGIVTFVATVNDETSTRNHIYDLKALTKASAKAMANYYESQIDMCTAQTITTDILNQQKLGIESWSDGLVSYKWWDTSGDGEPDQVTATIAQHPFDTFWYRFFDKDDFQIDQISWTEPVNTPVTVSLSFDSEDAGYNNMMGTYQLDNDNCVINVQLLLQNSNAGLVQGQAIGSAFTSPPTFVFLLSDGYDTFNNNGDRPKTTDTITVNNHCFDNATSNPSVTLNGITNSNTQMYFEHTQLNGDGGYEHIQLIPKNVQTQYESFIGGTNANQKYQLFLAECESVNNDNDSSNDIPSSDYEEGVNDCLVDGNNQYLYAMEDLDGGGDQDFNDLMLSSARDVIPNQLNSYTVLDDGSISLSCNNNTPPTLELDCHDPNSTNENTDKTFDIISTALDSDGSVASLVASASHGSVSLNNPSITYSPDADYYGPDTITVVITDNEGTTNSKTCSITVNEINLPPTISGNPQTSIQAGNNYTFTPSASDPDGDTLTYSITGQPSWASFDTSTGQLFGAPDNSNVGTYTGIIITVSDGTNSVSLPAFYIEVTQDTTNNAPVCSSIPTQSGTETELFSLNLDTYCTDPDNDDVSYELTSSIYSGSTTGLISVTIPDGAAGQVTVNVVASDGKDSTSTSFTLNITADSECTINETDNFSSSSEGWSGGSRDNYYRDYVINPNNSGSKTYIFGNSCKNVNVNISFYYWTNSWENNYSDRDKLELYINNSLETTYYGSYGGTKSISTATTDTSGNLTITFKPISEYNEYIAIDDISISK